MLPVFINIFLALHVFVSLLLLLVVLMQRPKSEGLGAAFGGGMTENIFGAQTTHVLGRFTVWLGGSFFVLTLVLSMLYARQSNSTSSLESELRKSEPVSIGTAAPAPTPTESEAAPATETPATETPAVESEAVIDDVVEAEEAVVPEEAPTATDAAQTTEAASEPAAESANGESTPAQ